MQTIRLNRKQWTLYLLVLIVIGCAGGQYPVEETRSSPYVPARDVLFSNEKTPLGFGAYGYLIFTERPDKYDPTDNKYIRYEAVFRAFISKLDPVDSYSKQKRSFIMPTFWLLQNEKGLDRKYPETSWIKFYDYSRAKILASSIRALSSKGPILVAWTQPFENVDNNEEALVLDLSDFKNDDLNRAIGVWMDQISLDPEIWHDGFNFVKAKWAFHNFFENYGDKIIEAVKTVKGIIG